MVLWSEIQVGLYQDFKRISSVNIQDNVLVGRPYGGISILWHKSYAPCSNIIQYDDDRLMGFSITLQGLQYLFLNVYLPYF